MARSVIDEISIQNFKFFPNLEKPIKLDGKHLLLYGENGSGKSSIYWALYTLMECALKEKERDIKKYFRPSHGQSLTNIHLHSGTPEWVEPFISVKLKDGTEYLVSFADTEINKNEEAKKNNLASDFIHYRMLFRFYNFAHSETIDLFSLFLFDILPYLKFNPITYWRKNWDDSIDGTYETESANKIWEFVKNGPRKNAVNSKGKFRFPLKSEDQFVEYQGIVNSFKNNINELLTFINTQGNPILNDKLGYNIIFRLELKETPFVLKQQSFTPPKYEIFLRIPDYEGVVDGVKRPHSFLNEAKLTAIALAIRLSILQKRLAEANLRILVLDDLLISLDMSNREKVLTLILKEYLDKYQVLILTHDRVLFDYIMSQIKLHSKLGLWCFKEMYVGQNKTTEIKYPVIIDGESDYLAKAEKYFEAKDFTTSLMYLRKELEKLVVERLPDEFLTDISGKFKDLSLLWDLCVDRYQKLGHPVSDEIKRAFQLTKLTLLNPQAHHVLSYPVYRSELEKAFALIAEIKSNYPIPESKILISKGMILQFRHPIQNYTIDFELLSDFQIDGLNGSSSVLLPLCKVLTWQSGGNLYWNNRTNSIETNRNIENIKQRRDKLDKIKGNLKKDTVLAITDVMFIENTFIINGLWSLKEILDKSGVVI